MKREFRKLRDRMARAYRLNTRGKRAFNRRFLAIYREQTAAIFRVVSKYEGQPINIATRDAMMSDFLAMLPPTPAVNYVQSAENGVDGIVKITLTPETSRLFAGVTD